MTSGTMIIKRYEDKLIKITVEEKDSFKFIATKWDKLICHENDRDVFVYESSGGAFYKAFDILAEHTNWLYYKTISSKGIIKCD